MDLQNRKNANTKKEWIYLQTILEQAKQTGQTEVVSNAQIQRCRYFHCKSSNGKTNITIYAKLISFLPK